MPFLVLDVPGSQESNAQVERKRIPDGPELRFHITAHHKEDDGRLRPGLILVLHSHTCPWEESIQLHRYSA